MGWKNTQSEIKDGKGKAGTAKRKGKLGRR